MGFFKGKREAKKMGYIFSWDWDRTLMLSHEGIKEIHDVNVALTCSMSVIKGRHKSYDTIKDAIT